MCAAPPAAQDVLTTLQDFKAAQEKRVRQYADFNRAFTAYLASKEEAPYREMMVATTREFAGVNEEVRAAELRLNSELARPDLAALLRKVQEGEKDKLRFTLIQQALKREGSEGRFSWQQQQQGPLQEGSGGDALPMQNGHADELSHIDGHVGHRCRAAPEPTEAELNNALAEATQELQAAVIAINDALEELREAEQDLREIPE